MTTKYLLATISLAAITQFSTGCTDLECGFGTIESDGICVAADNTTPNDPRCAQGTVYDDTVQGCVPNLDCGPNTEAIQCAGAGDPEAECVRAGQIVCVGTGGGGAISCPAPPPGRVTLCGQLVDVETNEPLTDGGGTVCNANSPAASGTCSLFIEFFEALMFAQDPLGTPPLLIDRLEYNSNGQFAASGIPAPALGFLGVGIDDNPKGSNDNYVLAGVALPAAGGDRRDDLTSYVIRTSTDDLWTTEAEVGTSLNESGLYVAIFLHAGSPAAGVQVQDVAGTDGDKDFYFDDSDPNSRTSIDLAQSSTGANGTGLLIGSALENHSGKGAEQDDCVWPSDLAASIQGVTFVQERHSEDPDTGENCE